jgi:hypothetical protein
MTADRDAKETELATAKECKAKSPNYKPLVVDECNPKHCDEWDCGQWCVCYNAAMTRSTKFLAALPMMTTRRANVNSNSLGQGFRRLVFGLNHVCMIKYELLELRPFWPVEGVRKKE